MSLPSRMRVALGVDDLALLVHDVVVLEDVLSCGEVHRLDLALRALDGLADQARLDGHVVGDVVRFAMNDADAVHAVAAEQAHEVVFEREVELRRAGVALAAGAAAELVVDAARLVALGAEDGKAAGLDDLDVLVGADALGLGERARPAAPRRPPRAGCRAARRMSSHRNSGLPPRMMSVPRPAMLVAMVTAPSASGLRDDVRFLLVELRVEHLVLDAALGEQAR